MLVRTQEAYTVIKKRTFWLVVLKPYKQIFTVHTFARTVAYQFGWINI
jgi:hypothetical protein